MSQWYTCTPNLSQTQVPISLEAFQVIKLPAPTSAPGDAASPFAANCQLVVQMTNVRICLLSDSAPYAIDMAATRQQSTVKINCACPAKQTKPENQNKNNARDSVNPFARHDEGGEGGEGKICRIYIFISFCTPPKSCQYGSILWGEKKRQEGNFFFSNMTLSLRLCHKHKTQRIVA